MENALRARGSKRFIPLAACVILALAVMSCSSEHIDVSATIQEARSVYLDARSHGAEDKAPFQFYSAELYLEQASEFLARGRTDTSAFVASRALNYAREALYITQIYSPAPEVR